MWRHLSEDSEYPDVFLYEGMSRRDEKCAAVAAMNGRSWTQWQTNGINLSESEKFHLTWSLNMLFGKYFLRSAAYVTSSALHLSLAAIEFHQIRPIQKLQTAFIKTEKKKGKRSANQH